MLFDVLGEAMVPPLSTMTRQRTTGSSRSSPVSVTVCALYDGRPEILVKPEFERVAPTAHGWLEHARRTAKRHGIST